MAEIDVTENYVYISIEPIKRAANVYVTQIIYALLIPYHIFLFLNVSCIPNLLAGILNFNNGDVSLLVSLSHREATVFSLHFRLRGFTPFEIYFSIN